MTLFSDSSHSVAEERKGSLNNARGRNSDTKPGTSFRRCIRRAAYAGPFGPFPNACLWPFDFGTISSPAFRLSSGRQPAQTGVSV